MVPIDPHEIHGYFPTVPVNVKIVGWSMHHRGGSPNFMIWSRRCLYVNTDLKMLLELELDFSYVFY